MEILKRFLMGVIYPLFYRLASLRPLRRKALFAEVRSQELTDSFSLLAEEIQRLQLAETEMVFLNNLTMGKKDLILGVFRMLWKAADAQVIFVNDSASFFGAFRLRRGSSMVQVWHACGAFKKWGYSVAEQEYGGSRKHLDRYSYHKNYTLVPVSGEDVCFAYAEAFGFPKDSPRIQPLGTSRTDIFFREDFCREARRRWKEVWPEAEGQKLILYAPTFRGQASEASAPQEFHPEYWKEKLGSDYVMAVRHHPFVKNPPKIPEECRDFVRDFSEAMTMEELLVLADICITDYSSVIFEYSLQEKPMIFWAFDRDEYEDWRGFYFPYETFVPGPIVQTEEEAIGEVGKAADQDMEVVRAFRKKYMGACDGHATERILRGCGLLEDRIDHR